LAAFADPGQPVVVRKAINVSNASIPSGLDNTEPVAIVSGLFPNSCYSWQAAEVTEVSPLVHEVKSFANVRTGMCLMVIVPFSEEVALGKFTTGRHTVRFLNGDGTYMEKTVDVNQP